jgi:hypothetical protein
MDLYNPSDFVGMAQTLKVLNAVRYYEIGIPITYEQCVMRDPFSTNPCLRPCPRPYPRSLALTMA